MSSSTGLDSGQPYFGVCEVAAQAGEAEQQEDHLPLTARQLCQLCMRKSGAKYELNTCKGLGLNPFSKVSNGS